jgi:DNA repair ATPase RecN
MAMKEWRAVVNDSTSMGEGGGGPSEKIACSGVVFGERTRDTVLRNDCMEADVEGVSVAERARAALVESKAVEDGCFFFANDLRKDHSDSNCTPSAWDSGDR